MDKQDDTTAHACEALAAWAKLFNCVATASRTPSSRRSLTVAARSLPQFAYMQAFFRDNAPWCICSVTLDVGPRIIAHAKEEEVASGSRVTVVDEHVSPSDSVLVARRKSG